MRDSLKTKYFQIFKPHDVHSTMKPHDVFTKPRTFSEKRCPIFGAVEHCPSFGSSCSSLGSTIQHLIPVVGVFFRFITSRKEAPFKHLPSPLQSNLPPSNPVSKATPIPPPEPPPTSPQATSFQATRSTKNCGFGKTLCGFQNLKTWLCPQNRVFEKTSRRYCHSNRLGFPKKSWY